NPRNNSLIISSPSENFELIEGLLEQLDTPGLIAKIKIFPVTNGDAASMVETLRSLIPSQVGANSDLQLSSAPGETNLAPLRFTVDVRSNSIIATGSEGDLRIVEMLILRLDEEDSMQRKTTVYLLKNAPAVDVALAVNEFLRNKRQVEDAGPGEVNPFQQLEKEVVVVPEPVANKLILSATPRYFDEIEELIEKLDEQPPEVVIQVLIAEVEIGEANEFGVELGIQDSVLFDRSLLGDLQTTENTTQQSTQNGVTTSILEIIQAASNLPGFDFNSIGPLGNSGSDQSVLTANQVGSQGISNFQVGRSNDQLGFGGLVLSASSQNISVLVRALQENNQLEILSRPQIRTLDNQPAFIQVGERVPRITSSQVTVNGQTNQVVLENVGLILGVTPRISPTGTVIMEIDAEKSDLGAESKGIPVSVSLNGTVVRSPRIETTTAQATVSAADGETVILGGLITKKTDEIHRKVPVLGDLPLLNNLFRFDSVVTTRTELLIILTPKVIRNSKDNERIKQAEMARMSWCAADVYDMHGDIDYMIDPELLLPNEADTEVIYPDQNPRGTSSRRSTPTGPPLPPEPEDTQSLLIPLDPSGERLPIGVGGEAQPLPMPDSGEGRRSREVQPTFWQENSRETVTRNR
ncbi:MAG: secretin N-terminal domain-containing protein, partial [Planctomycetota bacterium]|nr:secretin N-terminal domain-containing protein [Planctomycetota bacterium]